MMRRLLPFLLALLILPACGDDEPAAGDPGSMVLYTTVTADTVDSVVAGFEATHPGIEVEVFRAPTAEVSARIAADLRSGGIGADVLWLTDPLSMQQYDADGVLLAATPDLSGVPEQYREERFWGTRILEMVLVQPAGADPVSSWSDLPALAAAGGLVIPDPTFAGSAFAVFAYFALTPDFGFPFLESLAAAGTTVVPAPGDVVTGVAEGQYAAGITLDTVARTAAGDGSPIEIVVPAPGAITLYSPIAVTGVSAAAVDFVTYVLSTEGQTRIASTGWQPVDPEVPWEAAGAQVTIDWMVAFDRQQELLDGYRAIFGG